MSDIPDIPDDVLVAATAPVTMDDPRWFADTFSDLADPEVMRQAWQ
jgi:hypothetical protein